MSDAKKNDEYTTPGGPDTASAKFKKASEDAAKGAIDKVKSFGSRVAEGVKKYSNTGGLADDIDSGIAADAIAAKKKKALENEGKPEETIEQRQERMFGKPSEAYKRLMNSK